MLLLRSVVEEDLPQILEWRNKPEVYEGFYSQDRPITWSEHRTWWASRPHTWREFIVVLKEETEIRDIGVVVLCQLEHWSPEIGFFIGETELWGKGYGKEMVTLALEWLKKMGYEYCHTTVLLSNKRSAHLLWRLGFQMLGAAREREIWLTKSL